MKKLLILLLVSSVFVISALSVSAVECGSVPTNGCEVTVDTTFEPGTYDLPSGIIVRGDVTLDCNGAILKNEHNSTAYFGYLEGSDREHEDSAVSGGMIVLRGDNNIIKNCVIINSSTGITNFIILNGVVLQIGWNDGSNNTLVNNTIISSKYNGISFLDMGYGESHNNIIKNNSIFDCNRGIYISGNNSLVEDNFLEDNYNNIYLQDNLISRSGSGQEGSTILHSGFNNTIKNNYINGGSVGVNTFSVDYSKIINNTISHQEYGIKLSGNRNDLENNNISNNSYGLEISYGSSNNTIINNKFDSNTYAILLSSLLQYESTKPSNNTITKNIFKNNEKYAVVAYTPSFNNFIWDNEIYNTGISDVNESLNIYCIDCVGNRYYDGATGPICPESCFDLDDDGDGILNENDLCPETPEGESVNEDGCSCTQITIPLRDCPEDRCEGEYWIEYPEDGYDTCEAGDIIEEYSCEAISSTYTKECDSDDDDDGVPDSEDKCLGTVGEQLVYGCSCLQILDLKPGEDKGELKKGCSEGTIKVFTKQIGWAKNLFK